MARSKRKVFVARMPPTPCTQEMRDEIERIADSEEVGLVEIQRRAFALFLQANIRKPNTDICINESKEKAS